MASAACILTRKKTFKWCSEKNIYFLPLPLVGRKYTFKPPDWVCTPSAGEWFGLSWLAINYHYLCTFNHADFPFFYSGLFKNKCHEAVAWITGAEQWGEMNMAEYLCTVGEEVPVTVLCVVYRFHLTFQQLIKILNYIQVSWHDCECDHDTQYGLITCLSRAFLWSVTWCLTALKTIWDF